MKTINTSKKGQAGYTGTAIVVVLALIFVAVFLTSTRAGAKLASGGFEPVTLVEVVGDFAVTSDNESLRLTNEVKQAIQGPGSFSLKLDGPNKGDVPASRRVVAVEDTLVIPAQPAVKPVWWKRLLGVE